MGLGIGFQEDFADFLVGGGFAFRDAAEDGIFGGGRAIFGVCWTCGSVSGGFGGVHDFDFAAEFREVGLPCQQRERSAPVGAFFYFGAADGAVGGDVEPDVGAVHDEEFRFR